MYDKRTPASSSFRGLRCCTNYVSPTGNLDEDTAAEITKILKECAHQMNKCVVIVTHSNELAKQADVILKLRKGELQIADTPDTDTRKGRKN